MKQLVVLVAGGNGFVGKRVVEKLLSRGHKVIVHSRRNKAVPTHADVVINCVGIIREDEETFEDAHVVFTKWLLGLARKLKVQQYVHLSAIGAKPNGTGYQRSKFAAEELVQKSNLPYAIIRPSMIFGPDDKSVNKFRKICRTGFFPMFGNARVQPISVDTVADVIIAAAERRIRDRTAEIGGPEIFTYAQLADRIHPGVRAFTLPRPLRGILTFFGGWFTALPTGEMAAMLREDNTTLDRTVTRLGVKNPKLR